MHDFSTQGKIASRNPCMTSGSVKSHLFKKGKIKVFFSSSKHVFMPLYFIFTIFTNNKFLHTDHLFLV